MAPSTTVMFSLWLLSVFKLSNKHWTISYKNQKGRNFLPSDSFPNWVHYRCNGSQYSGPFLKEYKKWNVPYIYFTAVENGVGSVLVMINSLRDMILKTPYTANLFIRNRLLFVMKTLAAYGNHCNQSLLLFHPAEWCHKQEHIQYIISTLDEY